MRLHNSNLKKGLYIGFGGEFYTLWNVDYPDDYGTQMAHYMGNLLPEHFNKNIDVLSESKKHNIIAGKDTWELLIDTSNSIHEKYLSSWSKYH